MDSNRGLILGFALSTAVHVAATGAFVYFPHNSMQDAPEIEPIEVSLVQSVTAKLNKSEKVFSQQRISPSIKKAASVPSKKAEPSEFEKRIQTKIKKQEAELLKLSTHANIPDSKAPTQTSSELLTDPVKGKIFVGYFGSVKHSIQDLLMSKYSKKSIGHGSVCLFFVLNDKGALERVSVVDKESTGDEYLRELAVQCLRDAAPFGAFPSSLGADRISFSVTIYFEERG